jgi:hypothetical protein
MIITNLVYLNYINKRRVISPQAVGFESLPLHILMNPINAYFIPSSPFLSGLSLLVNYLTPVNS